MGHRHPPQPGPSLLKAFAPPADPPSLQMASALCITSFQVSCELDPQADELNNTFSASDPENHRPCLQQAQWPWVRSAGVTSGDRPCRGLWLPGRGYLPTPNFTAVGTEAETLSLGSGPVESKEGQGRPWGAREEKARMGSSHPFPPGPASFQPSRWMVAKYLLP